MIREEATELILESKHEKGLTFTAIAENPGKPKVWASAPLLPGDPRILSASRAHLGLPPPARKVW